MDTMFATTFLARASSVPAARRRRASPWRFAYWAYCALVLVFLLAPIAAIVPLSFSSGSFLAYPLPGWSLRWYHEVLGGGRWLRVATIGVLAFLYVPLLFILLYAFDSDKTQSWPIQGLTLDWFGAAFDNQDSFPLSLIQTRMSIPRTSQMPATAGDQLLGLAGNGTNEA